MLEQSFIDKSKMNKNTLVPIDKQKNRDPWYLLNNITVCENRLNP